MTTNNRKIAHLLEELADALEILGENPFKVNAYRKAARVLQDLPEDVADIYAREGLSGLEKIPGIGERIASKIAQYLTEGRIAKHDEVLKQIPPGLLDLLDIPGLGPRTVHLLWKELGVVDLETLKQVLDSGKVERLPGMGPKKVQNIRKGLELLSRLKERIPLGLVYPLVMRVVDALKAHPAVLQISPAGSFRRMKETVGDVDILVASHRGREVVETFVSLPGVERVLAAGDTKGSVILEDFQIDLRVVPPESWGAALQYFTGSKDHNVHLRGLARERGLKISEYGVFRGNERIAGATEEEVYRVLGMPWIPPELREDRGEIEAALEGTLPELVAYDDIRGDLHVHSRYSDGNSTLEEIVEEARKLGYAYVAVCDHSQSVKYARGLEVDRLEKKIAEIRALNEKLSDVVLLAGSEVDILPDGTLDYPDEVLARLDYVVASIHQWRKEEDVTPRILKALDHPHVHAIAHPTGRLVAGREGYRVDLEKIARKAAEVGVALEINAHAERMDLNDTSILQVKDTGVEFVLGTDAHHHAQMWMMRLGVGQARRAWLPPDRIWNTLPLEELREKLSRRRQGR